MMIRVILVLLLVTAVVLAVTAITQFVRVASRPVPATLPRPLTGGLMPQSFKTISFVLLIMLMLGVVTGWLGAA